MIRPLALAAALLAAPASEAATVTFGNLASYDTALGAPSSVSETFDGGTLNGTAIQQILGSHSFNNNRLQGIAGGGTNPARQFTTLVFSTRVTAFAASFANLSAGEIANVLLDGIHAAALDRLAQHDLEAVEAAEGPRHARIRWLTTARATRNDHDGPLIAAAIASGVTCPDELAARVLKHHDTPQRTASPSTPPQVAAQRRIAQANDERHAAMLAAPSSPLSPTTQASITDIRSKLR